MSYVRLHATTHSPQLMHDSTSGKICILSPTLLTQYLSYVLLFYWLMDLLLNAPGVANVEVLLGPDVLAILGEVEFLQIHVHVEFV